MRAQGAARRALGWLPLAAIVVAIAVFDARHHEFWRDETGAMLEASAVPWGDLLHAMRVEGIPPLYHAILKVLGLLLPHPAALIAAGALGLSTLLLGTHRLIEAIARSRRAALGLTIAFSLTYLYAYELGVMIRQYTLGLGLSLLSFAWLRRALEVRDRRALWAGAAAGGLSALTSAHSACVAGGGLLAFGLLSVARRRRLGDVWPILLTVPCFALVVYQALPFPGRTPEANQASHHPPAIALRLAVQALVTGVMPLDWWLAESFAPPGLARPLAALRSAAFWSLVAGAIAALVARARAIRRRSWVEGFDVLAVLLGWPPLLEIFVRHYWGFYRHHLFLGAPALVILAAWSLDRGPSGRAAGALGRAGLVAMVPWFVLQIGLGAANLALDYRYPFSDTKRAAALLPEGARVVAAAEWRSSGMVFWRPDLRLRSPSGGGRPYRYTSPDASWHLQVPLPIVQAECAEAPDRVFFAGPASSLGPLARCTSPIPYPRMPFADRPSTWESFELFRVDCRCVAPPDPRAD